MSLEDSIEMVSEMEDALTDTSITEIGMDVEADDRIAIQMAELEAELSSGTSLDTETPLSETGTSPISETADKGKREADKKKLDEMRRQIEEGLRS
jgi:hypothetical protein